MTALEALANTFIGFAVSWAATIFVLGYSPTASLGVTIMFAGLSFTRSYVLRRIFARLT